MTNSEKLLNEALKFIPWGTQTNAKRPIMDYAGIMPFFVERAKGCRFWDVDGREFIDYRMALGPVILGYCYDEVDKAVKRQIEKGVLFSMASPLEIELAKRITQVVPSFQINRGIEYIVENFGADRILFGSEFPLKSIGSARTFLEYSEFNDEDKIKIAGINLAKLLKMKLYNFETTSDDELIESAKRGEEIKIQIYDAHAHLGDENEITSGYTPLIKSAIDHIFQLNKKIGIKKCCVSSWLSIWSDHKLGNEITLKAIEKYPEHFIGYASFNPVYLEDWDDELNYWFVVKNFKGIKPYYPRTLIPYNDKRWGKLFEFGNKLKLFALLHPSDNFVDEVNEISLLYPEVNFLLAHTGIGFKHARDLIDIVKERKNVFFELTFTNVPDGLIEFLVNEVDSNKIIFGTDQPMRDPRPQLGWVIYSRIPVQDKIKILGFNMEKIIKNCSLKTNLERVK